MDRHAFASPGSGRRDALEAVLSAIGSSATLAEAVRRHARLARGFGYAFGAYADLTSMAEPVLSSRAAERWRAHYFDNGYHLIDPVVDYALHSHLPLSWRADAPMAGLREEQRRIYAEVADFGYRGGVCIPLHGPTGAGLIGLFHAGDDSLEPPAAAMAPLVYGALMVAEIAWHARRAGQQPGDQRRPPPPVRLTARERDCLGWVAEGFTVPKLAQRLGISEATVSFHLQNCRNKLFANTTAQAVARALVLGLLD